jgi:squalene-hopene/tetraprenyl-beta-curcumene cyclase
MGMNIDTAHQQADATPARAPLSGLDGAITAATDALLAQQRPDGHWVFELEADATIPAEYVLLKHYLGEPADPALEAKIAVYLRRIQGEHGGWPLFHAGDFDMSASVKAYFALKMIGDAPDAPHMRRCAIDARHSALGGRVCDARPRTLDEPLVASCCTGHRRIAARGTRVTDFRAG